MVCERRNYAAEERANRKRQLEELKKALLDKKARIVKALSGNKVSIEGWENRGDWCDECAIRTLRLSQDARIRQLVEEAAPQKAAMTFGHGHTHTHGGHTHTH